MSESPKQRIVCCIGDIHGFITKLRNLWSNLENSIDPSQFQTATIIFLGDYCDRGPNTREVIDFLISLPSRYPNQRHVFLSGNHDLAFAAFLHLLPPPTDGSEFSEGWKEYEASEEREGWFKGDGYEKMYLQGRRWAGTIKVKVNVAKGTEYQGSIYDAGPTFESYGVPHGSADLVKAVPDEHKKFLADMVWVHEEDDVFINTDDGVKRCKLIAVHAGLEKGVDVQEQLKLLKARDTRVTKIQALSGRKNVWDIPEELSATPTIIVSGHHAKLHVEGYRLIIDEGGGYKDRPVAAIILPSMKIIRDTDHCSVPLINVMDLNPSPLKWQFLAYGSECVPGYESRSAYDTRQYLTQSVLVDNARNNLTYREGWYNDRSYSFQVCAPRTTCCMPLQKMKLNKTKSNPEGQALLLVCDWELVEARKKDALDRARVRGEEPPAELLAEERDLHKSVELLQGKTHAELEALQMHLAFDVSGISHPI